MNTIWKTNLNITDEQIIYVPAGAKFLHLDQQFDNTSIQLWMECNSDALLIAQGIKIYVCGTGHPVPLYKEYLGTTVSRDLVWHVFCDGWVTK